ncbi:MAG: nucleotide exchange factor GrpE [Oscillospiraceae bacterium]|jgi:molecular chaperone GrpE|nr:nucleotide exchange factor GrpE [Oscillospiraceae bacterium]
MPKKKQEPENTPENENETEPQIIETEPEIVETPAEPTADELLAAEKDRYLRLAAEYDNYRKRSQKEREAVYADVRADTVTKLLPVYDNLARALAAPCSDEKFLEGVELTFTQFSEILKNLGVEEIAAVGEKFDPERHNAVSQVDNPDTESGTITLEFQKGFTLNGKVIRHSMVQVAQ